MGQTDIEITKITLIAMMSACALVLLILISVSLFRKGGKDG